MWYLTGFLVATGTPVAERDDDDEDDDFDHELPERAGMAKESTASGPKRRFFPSPMGLSLLVRPDPDLIRVTATWATTGGASTRVARANRSTPGYAPPIALKRQPPTSPDGEKSGSANSFGRAPCVAPCDEK